MSSLSGRSSFLVRTQVSNIPSVKTYTVSVANHSMIYIYCVEKISLLN